MAHKKYTLPRHTILAKQGARTGAVLIDFAISLLFTLVFVFALFRPVFKSKTNHYLSVIENESLNSGLYVKNEKNEVSRIPGTSEYTEFVGALEYFYLHYFTGNDIKEGLEPCKDKKDYDIPWFNEHILEIGVNEDEYKCFEYQKVDGVEDKTKIGVKIEDASMDFVNKLVQEKYVNAIMDDLNTTTVMSEAGAKYMTYSTISYVISAFLSGIIVYIVVPWLMTNGQTFGKKIYKLGLANGDGYKFSNKRLIMRYVPYAVVVMSLMLLIPVNIYLVLSIVTTILLVSFALAMSSPKRMSLHDFVAQTLVINLKESIIFNGPIDEEEYIAKEDGKIVDEIIDAKYEGEEPELKYEK